jgi:AcrR family transcriptional regulator
MPSSSATTRPKPRKTPRQARSAETVRVILEAAARILESQGLAGFTTNAVAERAGVSIGSLYQYFPSKEALTGALIRQETAVLLEDAGAAVHESSGRDALTKLIAAAVRHQLRRPALARLLDFEESRLPLDEEVRRVADRLRGMLAEVLRRPDLPPQEHAEIAAADVFAIVKGMVDAAGERGETDPQPLEARVGRAVFGYLAAG